MPNMWYVKAAKGAGYGLVSFHVFARDRPVDHVEV